METKIYDDDNSVDSVLIEELNQARRIGEMGFAKTEDELWEIVADACRRDTPTWLAFQRLNDKYTGKWRTIKALWQKVTR